MAEVVVAKCVCLCVCVCARACEIIVILPPLLQMPVLSNKVNLTLKSISII